MKKNVKHTNMLQPNPGPDAEGCQYLRFICRGCTMRNRAEIWEGFLSSIAADYNRIRDNSYMTLEEEPGNTYDPNAIQVVCRGEFFGTMGYVGKEFTAKVKEILDTCASYRVDVVDEGEVGQREVSLLLTWKS